MAQSKLNGSLKWIVFALTVVGMVYGFGQKSKSMEKDDEANATAIGVVEKQHAKDMALVREDLKEIKSDVKKLLSRP